MLYARPVVKKHKYSDRHNTDDDYDDIDCNNDTYVHSMVTTCCMRVNDLYLVGVLKTHKQSNRHHPKDDKGDNKRYLNRKVYSMHDNNCNGR